MRLAARPVILSILVVAATAGLAASQLAGGDADPVEDTGFGDALVAVAVSTPLEESPNASSVVFVDGEGRVEVVSTGEIAMGAVSARPGQLVASTPEDEIRWTQRNTTVQPRGSSRDMVEQSLTFADRHATVFNVGTKGTDSYYYGVSVWGDDHAMREMELEGVFMGLTLCQEDLYALMQPYDEVSGPPALVRLVEDGETWRRRVVETRLRLPGRMKTWDRSITCLGGRIGALMTSGGPGGAQAWLVWIDPVTGATDNVPVPDLPTGDHLVVGRWRDGVIVQDLRENSFSRVSEDGEVALVWKMPSDAFLVSASVTGEDMLLIWADTSRGHTITWVDPMKGTEHHIIEVPGLDDRLQRLGQYLSGAPADLVAGDSTSRPDFG